MYLKFYDFKIILLGGTNKLLELFSKLYLQGFMLVKMNWEINIIKTKNNQRWVIYSKNIELLR